MQNNNDLTKKELNIVKTAKAEGPRIEDYATVESICNGAPVYSFNNIIYVHGESPELYPGVVMQEGNKNPASKIKLKKLIQQFCSLRFSIFELQIAS